ncbi:hypothetical protein GCM10009559_12030 [Pseudonocardia zijingensis]|uniref:ABC transporter substrate-binding protein n=1 Tax=Pseudonocardia zijingensis TaxID=153376 RepID=A0ABP3ZVG4_9PSEU
MAGLSRRRLLGAALLAGAVSACGAPPTAPTERALRVLIATNEPWGTYHAEPLPAEAQRRGWTLTQLVPDRTEIDADEPVPVAVAGEFPEADLLVVTGAGDWPADCLAQLPDLPVVASSLAYLAPQEAPRAAEVRARVGAATASSQAEATSFRAHLGLDGDIAVVGSAQTDDLPARSPEPGTVLVLTSVTRADATSAAAPGAQLLLDSARRLAEAGRRVVVGLHPREDRALWSEYEISPVPSVRASAAAEVAIGIPGTVFPLVAAVGTSLVGCVDPALDIPGYLRDVCSAVIDDPAAAVPAVDGARPLAPDALTAAVGPVGGSAARLLDAWRDAVVAARR